MRVLVSGGGTGGHIYPAVALIQEIQKRQPDCQILYVGTPSGLESRLIPALGYQYAGVEVEGLPRKVNKKFFRSINTLRKGLLEARKVIKDFKPDLAIGTGGYVSGPILFQASRMGVKTLIHEQNSYPGITNRILSKFVDQICVTFESSSKFFKHPDRIAVTGNPIRNNFKEEADEADYAYFDFSKDKTTVFAFGGSNGSEALNDAMVEAIPQLAQAGLQVIHVTGPKHHENFMKILGPAPDGVRIYPYMDQMPSAYAVSDLIVTSSGAITLAEIAYVGLASILIPKGYTTENHQEYNARAYVDAGASKMILEKDLSPDRLASEILTLTQNPNTLKKMAEKSRGLGNDQAAEVIIDLAFDLVDPQA